jgi:serine/threonine protein kinase
MLHLSSLALKGAAQAAGDAVGVGAAAGALEGLVGVLCQRFTDQSKRLGRALQRANDRAWRAVEVALAGRSWWDRCKVALAPAQDRAFRGQVHAFLEANPLDGLHGFGPDFRGQCLAQLQAARKAKLLAEGPPAPDELARHVGDLSRFGDPVASLEAERRAVQRISERLREHGYDALAAFLELRPANGPPLLVAAVRFFFQREVENDRELFQGLAYARLEGLAQGQSAGFASLTEALDEHGEKLEELLGDVYAAVVRTRADVLDVKEELRRQGRQIEELGSAILRALEQHHLEKRALHTGDSLSMRDEDERRLVKDLVKRYRSLPAEERRRMPALLNAVGKLEVVAGDFESAQRDFRELARIVPDPPARAEAAHHSYLAALERRAWPEALEALKEAASLDAARFAPFPTEKFEPERILGAGGFGVAFLCRNTRSGGRVVIKTLRGDGLDRSLSEVFREAQALEELEHPAIIRIRDCDYADAGRTRPYLVMDYFGGLTLAEYVEQFGPMPASDFLPLARLTAEGLRRAHEHGILHRDVKPANLLVRRRAPLPPLGRGVGGEGSASAWEANLIDFGLAMRAEPKGSTLRASLNRTVAGASIAGTIEYAAPEQMGKARGVAVGPWSDVYGFGKTCCFALFGTPQPTFQHWQQLPRELADLLGSCLHEQHRARPQDFAAVLRELDNFPAPRAQPAPPPPARVLEAHPVQVIEDVLPVETRRPPRPAPRRGEWEEDEDAPRPKRRGGGGMVLAVALGGPAVVVMGFVMVFGLFSARPTVKRSAPLTPLVEDPVAWPGGLPAPPQPSEVKPIKPEEFKEVLATLEKKPSLEQLRGLAARLAVTDPTPKQKADHKEVNDARALGDAGPDRKLNLQRMEDNDEILQVSKALNRLLGNDAPPADKKLAAQAMQKWGAEANVEALIPFAGGNEEGIFDRRIEVHKALAAIGDERGVAAVASQLPSPWDRPRGTAKALIAFGPKADREVRKYLEKDDPPTQQAACEVLKEVGTRESLPALRRLLISRNPFLRQAADAAIRAIDARTK